MQVKKLTLSSFRNIENIEIFPDSQMNVIYGENAQGKTNIIEALWLFTGAKSFRGSKEQAFVTFGKEKAKNSIVFEALGVDNEAEMHFGEKREAFLNGKKLNNPARLAGNFNAAGGCANNIFVYHISFSGGIELIQNKTRFKLDFVKSFFGYFNKFSHFFSFQFAAKNSNVKFKYLRLMRSSLSSPIFCANG